MNGSGPVQTAFAVLLTAVSGLLCSLAFPDASWKPLAWVGVAPFLVALRLLRAGGAVLLSLTWVLVFSFAVGSWLPGGMAFYFDQPPAFGIALFSLMVCVMVAPYYVAFALVYQLLARRYDALLPMLTAAAWVAAEFGRGSLFTATSFLISNPWALLGYSQAGYPHLVQILDVTGVYGISFVLMVVNAALADLVLEAWERRSAWQHAARRLAAAAVPALAALVYGLAVLPASSEDEPGPDATAVAVVQGHIGLGERWHRHFHGRNLGHYLRLTNQVLDESPAKIVIWPEAAMTFFLDQEPNYRRAIRSLLQSRGVQLVSGIPRQGDSDAEYYNSVYLLSENAEVLARYDKQYLVPFAEYLPIEGVAWLERLFGRFREFSRGEANELLPTIAGPAGVMVCNEAVLAEAARERALEGAVFLVNPSNDSWSRHPKFTLQWFDIVTFRAIEQRRYLVRASTSGPSAIIDPWGRIQAQTERFARGVASGWIRPRSELSIYGRVGNLFAWVCTACVLLALAARASRARDSGGAVPAGQQVRRAGDQGSDHRTGGQVQVHSGEAAARSRQGDERDGQHGQEAAQRTP